MTMGSKQKKINAIIKQIAELSEQDLVELNNIYCEEIEADDYRIYNNDEEFFKSYFSRDGFSAVKAAYFGEYEFSADYVRFNGYGNLESIRYMRVSDLCELPAVIAEYALKNPSAFDQLLEIN